MKTECVLTGGCGVLVSNLRDPLPSQCLQYNAGLYFGQEGGQGKKEM